MSPLLPSPFSLSRSLSLSLSNMVNCCINRSSPFLFSCTISLSLLIGASMLSLFIFTELLMLPLSFPPPASVASVEEKEEETALEHGRALSTPLRSHSKVTTGPRSKKVGGGKNKCRRRRLATRGGERNSGSWLSSLSQQDKIPAEFQQKTNDGQKCCKKMLHGKRQNSVVEKQGLTYVCFATSQFFHLRRVQEKNFLCC
jgi:hypothetical protein